jgi:N-acetylglucosamine-6-phosphate deacetylase
MAIGSRLASINPAEILGLPETLVPGAGADFNIYDVQGRRLGTIFRGVLL